MHFVVIRAGLDVFADIWYDVCRHSRGALLSAQQKGDGSAMMIRAGAQADLEATLAIYNYEVINGVATLDLHKKTLDDWRGWFSAHRTDNHPLLVAENDGRVVGYATLSPYRSKEAYDATVELSVYVSPGFRRRGAASALMTEILRLARENPRIHNVVSVITRGNAASAALHKSFGFIFCGTIPEVGVKFGRQLSIDNYCLIV